MKIDIGAGYNKHPGFIRIDKDQNTDPDFVLDLEKDNLPFKDSTVEYVIASHILEHFGDGYFHCLQELYRVCKKDAIIEIHVPHPRHNTFINDPTHKRSITIDGIRLFDQQLNKEWIKTGAHNTSLGLQFGVNFKLIEYSNIIDPDYENKPEKYVLKAMEKYNNVVLEIRMKVVVIK